MRAHLLRVGTVLLATGLTTVVATLGSTTRAEARRLHHSHHAKRIAHVPAHYRFQAHRGMRLRHHARIARADVPDSFGPQYAAPANGAPVPPTWDDSASARSAYAWAAPAGTGEAPARGQSWSPTPSERISRSHAAIAAPPRHAFAAASTFDTGGNGLVAEARRWIGTNPTHRSSLWCGAFMNFVLERSGHAGSGSNLAKSFASFGHRLSGPRIGAIAVMSRHGGGHVGVVSGIDEAGNPILISGNSRGRRVAEGAYPRGRIYAYVMPAG